jgi:hypothetical protein
MSPRSIRPDILLPLAVNFVVMVILPVRLGLSGVSIAVFLAYAALSGALLTLAEDLRYLRTIFLHRDVRDYLLVRIVIVAIVAVVPFVIARNLAAA